MKKWIPLIPWAVFAVALGVRLWGLAHGLPDSPHPDENMVVRRALRFGSGDFNPHFFYYPSFSMYLFFILDGLYFAAGRLFGIFHSASDLALSFVSDPTHIYVIARSCVALADAGTALFLSLISIHLFGPIAGICSGLLWALSPTAVPEAQIAKPDPLMVFFAMASLYVLVTGNSDRRRALAGFLIGLSVSSKYQSVLTIPGSLLWIVSMDEKPKIFKHALLFLTAAAVGFFIGTPFALLDAKNFFQQFFEQSQIMKTGVEGMSGGPQGWFFYLKYLLYLDRSPLIEIALLLILWRGFNFQKKILVPLIVPVIIIYAVLGHQRIFGAHYFYIGLPFLFLLVGLSVEGLRNNFPKNSKLRNIVLVAVCFVLVGPYVVQTWAGMRKLSCPDTRIVARHWIEEHVPSDSRILVDASGPNLLMSRPQLEDLYKRAKEAGHIKADLFALQLKAHKGGGYQVFLTEQAVMATPKNLLDYSRKIQNLVSIENGLDSVRKQVQYVVTSEWEVKQYNVPAIREKYPEYAKFYSDLKEKGTLLDEVPEESTRPGPSIRIYKIS